MTGVVIPAGLSPAQARTARLEGGLDVEIFFDEIGRVWTGPYGITGDLLTQPGSVEPDSVLPPELWTGEFLARWSKAEGQAKLDVGIQYWTSLDAVRRAALADIAYQQGGGNAESGQGGLAGYHRMLGAVRVHDWITASMECLDSKAARQTPNRCAENAQMLRTGIMPPS